MTHPYRSSASPSATHLRWGVTFWSRLQDRRRRRERRKARKVRITQAARTARYLRRIRGVGFEWPVRWCRSVTTRKPMISPYRTSARPPAEKAWHYPLHNQRWVGQDGRPFRLSEYSWTTGWRGFYEDRSGWTSCFWDPNDFHTFLVGAE